VSNSGARLNTAWAVRVSSLKKFKGIDIIKHIWGTRKTGRHIPASVNPSYPSRQPQVWYHVTQVEPVCKKQSETAIRVKNWCSPHRSEPHSVTPDGAIAWLCLWATVRACVSRSYLRDMATHAAAGLQHLAEGGAPHAQVCRWETEAFRESARGGNRLRLRGLSPQQKKEA